MKKILLVEDDPNKIKQIQIFFEESKSLLPELNVEVQKSYQSGLNSILNFKYDLVLLDMSMHNFDRSQHETGGEFMKFGGEDILKEMEWNDILTKTIIVTQYDLIGDKYLTELKDYWKEEFSPIYIDTVYYGADETNWKDELLTLIKNNI
jgi:CheY-like chemotaxis protein